MVAEATGKAGVISIQMSPDRSRDERFPTGPILVLFTIIAFAALLLVVFERIGMPSPLIATLGLAALVTGLGGAALMGTTMRPSHFFAAGRAFGIVAGGVAAFSVLVSIAATLGGGFEAETLLMPKGKMPLLAGALAAFPAALVIAPAIRRSGAYTPVDFLRGRFGEAPALISLVLAALILMPVIAAAATLAVDGLIAAFAVPLPAAQSLALLCAALPFIIGGLRSGRMIAVGIGGLMLVGLALPFLAMLAHELKPPTRFADASLMIEEARAQAALLMKQPATSALPPFSWLGAAFAPGRAGAAEASLTLGLIVVLLLCGLFSAARNTARGAGSALMTGLMLASLPVISLAIAAGTVLDLKASLVGASVTNLPASFLDNSLAGLLRLCGTDPSATALTLACAPAAPSPRVIIPYVLKPGDIGIEPALLGFHATEALRMPGIASLVYRVLPALVGLAALGLSGFALAAILAHDGLYKLIRPDAVASSRLAATRLFTIIAIAAGIDLAAEGASDLPLLLKAALALGAATLLPLLLLALLPRAGRMTALLTLAGGLVVFVIFLAQGAQAIGEAGLYGFIGALVMACAGLASCPPSEAERQFANALLQKNGPALILDRAT